MREAIFLVADVVVSISLLETLAGNDSSKNGGFGKSIARASTQARDNFSFMACNQNELELLGFIFFIPNYPCNFL